MFPGNCPMAVLAVDPQWWQHIRLLVNSRLAMC